MGKLANYKQRKATMVHRLLLASKVQKALEGSVKIMNPECRIARDGHA